MIILFYNSSPHRNTTLAEKNYVLHFLYVLIEIVPPTFTFSNLVNYLQDIAQD
jgi:hypothetical protein